MINNGRRIDQRTTMSQQGGAEWFRKHLQLNGFDPFVFDGRDPAAFLWAILEMESRLEKLGSGAIQYPVRLPYGIAHAPKGAGFPGEGTNLAHNLPLMANPHTDANAAARFNEAARKLWVPPDELRHAIEVLANHARSGRPKERDHALVHRRPILNLPAGLPGRDAAGGSRSSPMSAIDEVFTAVVEANPHLRPRVGNPDEMRSNRLIRTLGRLKFRVTHPEPGVPESVHGHVITALNEEAVVSAALANKGGINLVHSYEAFGPKMHGAVRQEIIFARNLALAGRPPEWISIPVVMTSHTWENGKNEHSHQDPCFAETMMGEPAPFSRVFFPADFNTAAAVMGALYQTRGQIWTIVAPKADSVPDRFSPGEAALLAANGVAMLEWAGHRGAEARIALAAVGAYQLGEVLRASRRLCDRDFPHAVFYMLEPGAVRSYPFGGSGAVVLTHTRPHAIWGVLGPLHGSAPLSILGYRNEGGTLDTSGMMMVNRCTWAHCLLECARILGTAPGDLLESRELAALHGEASPHGVLIPFPGD